MVEYNIRFRALRPGVLEQQECGRRVEKDAVGVTVEHHHTGACRILGVSGPPSADRQAKSGQALQGFKGLHLTRPRHTL
jgi:hypothetical protein